MQDIDVQKKRLARARRLPEGNLVEITHFRRRQLKALLPSLVVRGDLLVDLGQQLGAAVEIPVKVELGDQQRQPLVVLEFVGCPLFGISLRRNLLPVADDPQVIRRKFVLRAFRPSPI